MVIYDNYINRKYKANIQSENNENATRSFNSDNLGFQKFKIIKTNSQNQ